MPTVERARRWLGLAVHVDRVVDEIDDPVLRDTRSSVEARLVVTVDLVGALGDLDDQYGLTRVRVAVGAGIVRHHGDVGLWLRVRVERDRQLRVDLPRVAERPAERRQHAPDRRGMPVSVRLADHQQTVEQLQALTGLEPAELDQALVLDASPVSGPGERHDRGGHRAAAYRLEPGRVNVPEPIRSP